jgi:hypothetical protein
MEYDDMFGRSHTELHCVMIALTVDPRTIDQARPPRSFCDYPVFTDFSINEVGPVARQTPAT